MLGDIPILLLLLSQTLIIEPLHVWLSTIVIIGIISGWAYRNGLAMGKKADIDKVVSITQYNEDNKDINEKINLKADREVLKTYMELTNSYYLALHERMQKIEETQAVTTKETTEQYRIITNSLSSLNAHVENIEKKLN